MSGDEVLQYVQTFTEVGLDGQLDGMTRRIGHQASHAGQLFDLLIGTTGSGVRHHIDVVVLIQAGQKVVGQLVIRVLPGLDNLFVALFLGDQTAAVVLCDAVHGRLGVLDQLGFALRHGHIGNGNGHGRTGGILVTDGLDVVQGHGRLGCAVDVDYLFQNLF